MSDANARTALDEAARRLAVIGRISRQLYEAEGVTRNLRAFLEPLCADVVDAGGKPGVTLTIAGGEDMTLPSDAAIPVALIVAEAVSNAIEHGFADRDLGRIEVELVRDARGIRVEVRDDGHGLPESFDIAGRSSLGLSSEPEYRLLLAELLKLPDFERLWSETHPGLGVRLGR